MFVARDLPIESTNKTKDFLSHNDMAWDHGIADFLFHSQTSVNGSKQQIAK